MRSLTTCTRSGLLAFLTFALCLVSARAADFELESELAAQVEQFVKADRLAPPPPCQVLFVGSSSIVKWKDTIATDLAPMPVIDRGFGGSHIEYIDRWFNQVVAPYHPRAVVFYAGENDIDAGKSVGRVLADFDAFMARKTQTLGTTPVYFISIKPSKLRWVQFPLQSQVNSAIRARSGQRTDLHFIDVVTPMLENGRPKDVFEPDGLHMTRAGYTIWTRVVKQALLPTSEAELAQCTQSVVVGVHPSASPDGLVYAPSFDLPLSRYMSEEAKQAFVDTLTKPAKEIDWNKASIGKIRQELDDEALAPDLERLMALYRVKISDRMIVGVHTRIVTPELGIPKKNAHRVLLNLHGGGFFAGANTEALVASIPVAAVARMKVITIDYRQGPEYHFPAARDDVIAVYRALVRSKELKPKGAGLYGCSAGGILATQVTAALNEQTSLRPGAIAIVSAGAYGDWSGDPLQRGVWGGDSRYWGSGPVYGKPGLPLPFASQSQPVIFTAYINGINVSAPWVSPAESPEVLAKFPPALILTGTRAFDMSAAVETHRQLIKAGVPADLHVWDGLGHCFFYNPDLPESREAYQVIATFFDHHLR